MDSPSHARVLYRDGDIAIPLSCHNRYIEMNLSHVGIPEHPQGFFAFAFALGFVSFAHNVDNTHAMRGLPPVDHDSMSAAYDRVTLQKFLEWENTNKTKEGKQLSLANAMYEVFGDKARTYWDKKKLKYPGLDCEGLPIDTDDDHGGYVALMIAVDEGPGEPGYEEAKAMLAVIDKDGSIIRKLRRNGPAPQVISQAETIVAMRSRKKEAEMAMMAAESKANKKNKELRRTEKRMKIKQAKLDAENGVHDGGDAMDVDEDVQMEVDDAEDHSGGDSRNFQLPIRENKSQ